MHALVNACIANVMPNMSFPCRQTIGQAACICLACCGTAGELGAGSNVLQQASDEEGERLQGMGQQQQEQQLQQALEPAKGDDAEGADAPIPVGPAVTGELI
jgi:hypothetical protein